MSIEWLCLDNRLKLAFISSWETFWDYARCSAFFFFFLSENGWLKSANNLDKPLFSQAKSDYLSDALFSFQEWLYSF